MSKKELTVWFDSNGDLLMQGYNYNPTVAASHGYKSEIGKDFKDVMKVVKIQEYRRKNARVHLQSLTSNRKYFMFVDEFNEVIQKNLLQNLTIDGTWRFVKKGTGQALELLEAKP